MRVPTLAPSHDEFTYISSYLAIPLSTLSSTHASIDACMCGCGEPKGGAGDDVPPPPRPAF